MPIYPYRCDKCGNEIEKLGTIGEVAPLCLQCGAEMVKLPTTPAMVKMKGEGGYPSRRKFFKGTCPYCGNAKEWNPLENDVKIKESNRVTT